MCKEANVSIWLAETLMVQYSSKLANDHLMFTFMVVGMSLASENVYLFLDPCRNMAFKTNV